MIINICCYCYCCPFFVFFPWCCCYCCCCWCCFFAFKSFPCGKVLTCEWCVLPCVCVCARAEVLSHSFILFQFLRVLFLFAFSIFLFSIRMLPHPFHVYLSRVFIPPFACLLCPTKFVFVSILRTYDMYAFKYNLAHQNRLHMIATLV